VSSVYSNSSAGGYSIKTEAKGFRGPFVAAAMRTASTGTSPKRNGSPKVCRIAAVPRRDDIHKILLIGSGPIVIGQACEFDYSGTQACKALREEGYEVVLVNSNPATIMTDPDGRPHLHRAADVGNRGQGDREGTPDALLPTLGGQTG
jgi:hypothetical protein